MSYSNRLFLYGPIGAFVAAAAAYSLFWYVSSNMFAARLDAANGREFLPGVTFAFADKTVGGFPFRLDFVLSGVTIAQQGTVGETAWRAERVAMHKLTYRNDRFIFESDGLQSLSWPGRDGRPRALHLTPGIARASAVLANGALARIDVELLRLQGRIVSGDAASDGDFVAAQAQAYFLRRDDEAIALALRATDIKVSPALALPLGQSIAEARIDGAISMAGALTEFLSGRSDFATALETWRQGAGAVEITSLAFTSDQFPNGATLSGRLVPGATLGLEGALQTPDDAASPLRIVFQNSTAAE